jgi:uroporphyrinogen-III synthase
MHSRHIIAVTRPVGKGQETAEYIQGLGCIPLIVHSVQLNPRNENELFADIHKTFSPNNIDWTVFMSTEGVRLVLDVLKKHGQDPRQVFGSSKIVAVGEITKASLSKEFQDIIIPREHSSSGIAAMLSKSSLQSKHIVLFRSSDADDSLHKILQSSGATVTSTPVYSSAYPDDPSTMKLFVEELQNGQIAAILFTSSRSVSNLFNTINKTIEPKQLQRLFNGIVVGAIGPVTAEAIRRWNVNIDLLSNKTLIDEAIKALVQKWKSRQALEIIPAV